LPIGGLPGGSRTDFKGAAPPPGPLQLGSTIDSGGFNFLTYAPEVDPATLNDAVEMEASAKEMETGNAATSKVPEMNPASPESSLALKPHKSHCEECGGQNCPLLE